LKCSRCDDHDAVSIKDCICAASMGTWPLRTGDRDGTSQAESVSRIRRRFYYCIFCPHPGADVEERLLFLCQVDVRLVPDKELYEWVRGI
jgi:hypothetical protein